MSKRSLQKRAPELVQAALRNQRAGKTELAVELYEQALRAGVEDAAVLTNLGEACRKLGRLERACSVLSRAVRLAPELAPAHYNLGLTLDQQGELEAALSAYAQALELAPELPELLAYFLEGLRELGKFDLALQSYARFVPLVNDSARLRCALGYLLLDVFRVDEAATCFRAGQALEPESLEAQVGLAAALLERGEATAAIAELRRVLARDPSQIRAHANLVYLLPFAAETRPEDVLAEAARFEQRHTAAVPRLPERPVLRGQRLRIGYLSADFRQHPLALFIPELLRHHDRQRVEVVCYSNVARPDAVTAEILALADDARDLSRVSDAAAAEQIAQDRIDVLIDLDMHTGQSRPLLLARKPAPVQACFLAYPGTTGLSAIDYRFTDPFLDPPGAAQPYSERSLQLDSFWSYAPPASDPEPGPLPALSNGFPTFGALHSFKKVSPRTLELWAEVLAASPDARLIALAPAGESEARLRATFEARGVERTRIELVRHAPRAQYLRHFERIDCGLDTWPYAGGTSSLDAFWMGVPVVSLLGPTVAGRAGASVAGQLQLSELATATPAAFVAQARELVGDLPRLAELRAGLRQRLRESALMNGARYAASVEAALFGVVHES